MLTFQESCASRSGNGSAQRNKLRRVSFPLLSALGFIVIFLFFMYNLSMPTLCFLLPSLFTSFFSLSLPVILVILVIFLLFSLIFFIFLFILFFVLAVLAYLRVLFIEDFLEDVLDYYC